MASYALVMIVKDAAADLPRTLTAARRYISSWTIHDTGSTDGTQKLIRKYLKGIPGTLTEVPWVNFGHNRSAVFAEARGTADWLLAADADMAFTIKDGWEPDPTVDAYMIEMGNHTTFAYRLPLLLRGDLPWISVGRVHEYTSLPAGAGRDGGIGYGTLHTDSVTIDMLAIDRSSPAKYQMHAKYLEESLAENPDNPRDTYYLAQTYNSLGDPRAREMFQKRAAMGGYDQEVFYATFRAAMLAPTWQERVLELTAAWEMRPHRIEPLVGLTRELNTHGMHQAAYALTGTIPIPNPDVMFVHIDCWRWGLKFERAIAAWWCGHKVEARVLCDELLADPTLPASVREQVKINRAFE